MTETDKPWAERMSALVGSQVERYRREQGLIGDELAARCTELGYKLDKHAVSKLETGVRKSVTVAEMLVLAAALRVPPIALLLPLGEAEATELVPDPDQGSLSLDVAYSWLAGERGWPPYHESYGDAPDLEVRKGFVELRAHLRRVQDVNRSALELEYLRAAKATAPQELADSYGPQIADAQTRLRAAELALFEHRRSMRLRGWKVLPQLGPEMAEMEAEDERNAAEVQGALDRLAARMTQGEASADA